MWTWHCCSVGQHRACHPILFAVATSEKLWKSGSTYNTFGLTRVNDITSAEIGGCSRRLVVMPSGCGQMCLLFEYRLSYMRCDYCFRLCWCIWVLFVLLHFMNTGSFFCFFVPCAQGHNKVTSWRLVMLCGRQFSMQVYTRLGAVPNKLCLSWSSVIELSALLCHSMSLKGDVTADMFQECQWLKS